MPGCLNDWGWKQSNCSQEIPISFEARMHTCLDQYNSNKIANANSGLNWIMQGGGNCGECDKRLKP
jgi:hypothetical protein